MNLHAKQGSPPITTASARSPGVCVTPIGLGGSRCQVFAIPDAQNPRDLKLRTPTKRSSVRTQKNIEQHEAGTHQFPPAIRPQRRDRLECLAPGKSECAEATRTQGRPLPVSRTDYQSHRATIHSPYYRASAAFPGVGESSEKLRCRDGVLRAVSAPTEQPQTRAGSSGAAPTRAATDPQG